MKLVKNARKAFLRPYLPEKYFFNQTSNIGTASFLIIR